MGRHVEPGGAGSEPTPERPVLDVRRVLALADSMQALFGLLVLVTTFRQSAMGRCDGAGTDGRGVPVSDLTVEQTITMLGGVPK